MLGRILLRSQAIRILPTLRRHLPPHPAAAAVRPFSAAGGGGGGGGNDDWKDGKIESWHFSADQPDHDIFGTDAGDVSGISDEPVEKPIKLVDEEEPTRDVFGHIDAEFTSGGGRADDDWLRGGDDGPAEKLTLAEEEEKPSGDVFGHIDKEFASRGGGGEADDDWLRGGDDEKSKPWSFDADSDEVEKLFDVPVAPPGKGVGLKDDSSDEEEEPKVDPALVREEKYLSAVLKGPDRAFGDLISASGITESMLDSLMILKDLEDIPGLPPLSEIEDIRLAKSKKTNLRADIERKKQEEIAKSYVRKVDDKGRSYGTGRRKCGIARVWIQPGDGKFIVNDKPFDVYFPILDHRAALLRPFTETKTLGCWDVKCTVKGGGLSGQVGAIRLGISRALQNWEPGLRPYLKEAGFMTRDPRVVERKKPGKAKARKSFQWVKR